MYVLYGCFKNLISSPPKIPMGCHEAPAKCLGCAPLELNEAMRHTLSKVDKDTAETLARDPG